MIPHNIIAPVVIGSITAVTSILGQLGQNTTITLGEALTVFVFVATLVAWLARKLQKIEDDVERSVKEIEELRARRFPALSEWLVLNSQKGRLIMQRQTPLVTPSSGGRLMSAYSEDTVGMLNYVRKVNFRRINGEVEGRREGWVKFRPNTDAALGTQPLNVGSNITLLAENVRPNSDRCVIAATQTTIYRYVSSSNTWLTIGSGYSTSGKRWQTETINGWIIFNNGVDLPCSYRVEDSAVVPLKELRENGIASVGTITQLNGFLLCMNVREIKAANLNAIMNGLTPYGLVDNSQVNHIPYRVIWPEPAQPTNWAPLFSVSMASSSATITLPFPSSAFVANVTRVAVIKGGPNGDVLGGDSAHPDGILVTAVAGNVLTLEIPTNAGISYPRTVQVTRWADVSSISAYKDLQGDASHITTSKPLHKKVSVIYRTRGIFTARYTGSADEPFVFTEMETNNVPSYPDAVASVGGEYHVYPTKGGFFYAFDGVNAPQPFGPMNDCSNLIFDGLTPSSSLYAVENPLTKETWFCRSDRTICLDHETKSVSEIDDAFGAAALVSRPGWDTDWFIIAKAGTIYTYGYVDNAPTTWLRDGVNPGGYLRWGRTHFGDSFNEKRLRTYLMQFATGQTAVPMRLIIRGSYGASEAMEELLSEVFPEPAVDGGMVPVDYQAVYFQDELRIDVPTNFHSADYDHDWRISTDELARVTELYNYTNGAMTRTGEYHTDPLGIDGFAPGPGAITTHHSADTNKNGRISLTELSRVIELRNTSFGSYYPQEGTEDGYDPGAFPEDADVRFIGRLMERAAIRSAGTTRNNA